MRVQSEFCENFLTRTSFFNELIVRSGRFLVGCLVSNKQTFKSRHLRLAEQRRISSKPQIPHQVAHAAHFTVQIVHQRFSLKGFAVDFYKFKFSVFCHRNAAVVEKIAVDTLIQRAVTVEKSDVPLQFLRIQNRGLQSVHHFLFLFCQLIWIVRIYCWEVGIPQFVYCAVNFHRTVFPVNFIQNQTVFQMILRMRHNPLSFHFELADGNGFVHLRSQGLLNLVILVSFQNMGLEELAWVIAVHLLCKGSQRSQVDAISVFQHIKIIIADIHTKNVGNARPVSCRSAHPDNIVIAPLKIHVMIVHQEIQNCIGMRPSVKDISNNM